MPGFSVFEKDGKFSARIFRPDMYLDRGKWKYFTLKNDTYTYSDLNQLLYDIMAVGIKGLPYDSVVISKATHWLNVCKTSCPNNSFGHIAGLQRYNSLELACELFNRASQEKNIDMEWFLTNWYSLLGSTKNTPKTPEHKHMILYSVLLTLIKEIKDGNQNHDG